MGVKRTAAEAHSSSRTPSVHTNGYPPKKDGFKAGFQKKPDEEPLIAPRADWYATELPDLPITETPKAPPQKLLDDLHQHANSLLEVEARRYTSSNASGSSQRKFMSTIMTSGTLEDKVSALTLQIQESPLHATKALENLLGLGKKRSRDQALMAVAAIKDLLGQGMVLPSDRTLRAFAKQPALLSALQGRGANWKYGDSLPGGLTDTHLILWVFEDWLKKSYFELLKVLESWCADEVEYARVRAINYVYDLLVEKPEQEENLLRLLVNKLGDTSKKIASNTSHQLLKLQNTHPGWKSIIVNAIESDCLLKPGQSMHARYYAIITLNQTILGNKDTNVANRLLGIYFELFIQLLKPQAAIKAAKALTNGRVQGGGGKPGKKAAQKAKLRESESGMQEELREKMIAQILTGVNRAFPFAQTDNPTFEKQMDTIFRVTHSANFNTAIQALSLIQKISSTKHYSADRFYRTLYESLLDPRLLTSSKQIMYLNLLYRSLKSDINVKRVQAFVKRLLQMITMHDPPFVCGILYLISELEASFPSIRNMLKEAEIGFEDEEEHFVDVPEEQTVEDSMHQERSLRNTAQPVTVYDPRKRDPEHSNADRSALWEMLPFLAHFHPSVAVFAEALVDGRPMPPKPDPTTHTLIHFLDRFSYRNAKTKTATTKGSSIMQPLAGSHAADLLIKGRSDRRLTIPLNSESFRLKDVSKVDPSEVYFHSYFNKAHKGRPSAKQSVQVKAADGSDEEDEDEDEIFKAIANSRPDVEEPGDDDDDLSMGDLEEAYSDDGSDDGDNADAGVVIADFPDEELVDGSEQGDAVEGEDDDLDDDSMPDLESGDEAMLDDEDDLPPGLVGFDDEEDGKEGADVKGDGEDGSKKKNKKRKLKHLPTFASAEDYAQMLADEPDDY